MSVNIKFGAPFLNTHNQKQNNKLEMKIMKYLPTAIFD